MNAAKQNILAAGQPAPDFTLPSTQSSNIKLSELRGQPIILAFYPGDFTPVCTSQLSLYNEVLDMFEEHQAKLLGISVDDIDKHQDFVKARGLNFPLLADSEPKGDVASRYGVYDEKRKVCKRALFVIDKEDVIQWSYVAPPGINPGADGILNALEGLS